jgi:hypothetical protein
MFVDCLPHAVAEVPVERHTYQTEVLSMMAKTLQDSRAHAEMLRKEAEEKLEAGKNELASRKRKAEEASNARESAKHTLEMQNSRLSGARQAVTEAEKCHKPADKEKATAEDQRHAAQEERDQAAAMRDGMLAVLRSGGWEDADGQEDAIDHVTISLKKMKAEDALVAACAGAFRTRPEKRRRFDSVVEQGVVEAFDKYIVDLDAALEKTSAAAEDTEAEALGLWAILDCARDKVGEAAQEVQTATAAQEEASAYCDAMDAALNDQEKAIVDLSSNLKLQSNKIDAHVSVIDALDRLCRHEYDATTADPVEIYSGSQAPLEEVIGEPIAVQ